MATTAEWYDPHPVDEPESLGAISLAGREKLDNLIFVVNCNLQSPDGPGRGSGTLIQELEGIFRGAGWYLVNATKVDPTGVSPSGGPSPVPESKETNRHA